MGQQRLLINNKVLELADAIAVSVDGCLQVMHIVVRVDDARLDVIDAVSHDFDLLLQLAHVVLLEIAKVAAELRGARLGLLQSILNPIKLRLARLEVSAAFVR